MHFRKKTLVTIQLTFLFLMVVLYIASQTLIIGSFSELEKQISTENVERVSNALHDDISRLNSTTADWAQWDDAYAFIQDGNNDFIRSNLVNSTFSEIKLNIMMFVNTKGRIVYTKAFDLEEDRETPVPQFFLSLIKPESAILRNVEDSLSGILLLPEDPMIIASQPIMTSEGDGPIMGTLIMGRFFNSKELELLSEKTRISLKMYRINKENLPDDVRTAENILSGGETIYVSPVSDEIIRGYTVIKDVFGNPGVILGTDMPRNIHIYGKNMIHYFLYFFVLITVLFVMILVFIVKKLEGTEKVLDEREEHLRSVVDNATDAIVTSDSSGKITFWNKSAERIFGYTKDEVLGRNVALLMPERYRHAHKDGMQRFDETGEPKMDGGAVEVTVLRKDGEEIQIEATLASWKTAEDTFFTGIIRDIAERKKAEEEKRNLEDQLHQSQKIEAVGQLAGGVAHDFNNILSAITAYGSLLQVHLKKDGELRNHADQILVLSERAASLTKGLLAFSRKQVIRPRPVMLNDIIKRAENLLLRLIREDIELNTVLADEDLTIMAESVQIEQVLMNLATNARDAMPDGGVLTIETGYGEIDSAYINTHGYGTQGSYALITISDTGIGMDVETKQKIFEPFFTTKEVGKGTGLGLATIYGIIKQHNGFINVSSESGEGSSFTIYLPLIEAEVERADEKAFVDTKTSGGETILLAEDEDAVRRSMRSMLESLNYKVIEAVNGEDAVEKYKENIDRVELVILDVIMPKKNGKQVYDEIMKIRTDVKILFMSGYTDDVLSEKGILVDGLHFAYKPVLKGDLLRKIQEVLSS